MRRFILYLLSFFVLTGCNEGDFLEIVRICPFPSVFVRLRKAGYLLRVY